MSYYRQLTEEEIEKLSFKIGECVNYKNTRGSIKQAKIESLYDTGDNNILLDRKIWFVGKDTVTLKKVWSPLYKENKTK